MKLLIVEDDPALSNVLLRLFEPIADMCKTVSSFTDGLNAMISDRFDIVTLDLNLPDTRDRHTLERIKELKAVHPQAIVIVYTGITSPGLEKEALDAGADGFITKADAATSNGGFLGSLHTVFKNLLNQPLKYKQSINLLEKIVNKLASNYAPVQQAS